MKISEHLKQYASWQQFNDYSEETIKSYQKQIKRFIRDQKDFEVKNIKKEHLINWMLILKERKVGNGYILNCLWAMRGFLKFLKTEMELKVYNFENFRIPKRKIPEYIEYLENKEIKQLLGAIPVNEVHGLRMRAYVEFLVNTGLRPSEALNFNRENLQGNEIEIIGKGKKKRKIYLNDRVMKWLNKYLKSRNDNSPALFVSHCRAKRWSLRTAEELFQKYIKKSEIKKRVVLHTLRHTYATNLLSNGCPPDYIQKLLGHSKIDTTRIYYLSIRQKEIKKSHFKYLDFEN